MLGTTEVEAGSYRNATTAQPANRPVVPHPITKPVARPQTALVVGLPDQVITTERDHRIKSQFPWQCVEEPNVRGLSDSGPSGRTAGKPGNAPHNDQSGTWIRFLKWLPGLNWNIHILPLIGNEVLVDFHNGDSNQPAIVGQGYNVANLPLFPAGHEASKNHPGVLSGWMSHNHEVGNNQWVLDDAPSQLRIGQFSVSSLSQSRH